LFLKYTIWQPWSAEASFLKWSWRLQKFSFLGNDRISSVRLRRRSLAPARIKKNSPQMTLAFFFL
jgi:hypothetical protein